MDWAQATPIEQFWFIFGAIVSIVFGVIILGGILYMAIIGIAEGYRHFKRKRKTTPALKCELCHYNVEGENSRWCERFDLNITNAPVRNPGCSWGIDKERIKR